MQAMVFTEVCKADLKKNGKTPQHLIHFRWNVHV